MDKGKSTSRAETRADREAIAALVAQEKYAEVMQNSIVERTAVVELSCPDFLSPLPFAKAIEGIMIETVDQLHAAHYEASNAVKYAVVRYFACGEFLARKKKEVGHGPWSTWLKENIKFSHRTASDYILLHNNRAKLAAVANLESSSLRELLALCKDRARSRKAKPEVALAKLASKWKPASEAEAFKEIRALFVKHITPGSKQCAELIEMLHAFYSGHHSEAISESEKFLEIMPTIQTVAFDQAA